MGESEEENSLPTKPAIAVRFTAKSGGYPGDGKSEEQIEKAWEIFRPSFEEGSRIFLPNQSMRFCSMLGREPLWIVHCITMVFCCLLGFFFSKNICS